MLLPKHVGRYGNLPFFIEFSNIKKEPPHFHNELEIVFVLQGTVKYKVFHQSYELSKGEMIIIDTQDLHYIYDSTEDLVMINMYIDLKQFNDEYPNIDYMIFACEYNEDDTQEIRQNLENKVANLKTMLSELMSLTVLHPRDESIVTEKLHDLIAVMVEHFQSFYFEQHTYKTLRESPPAKSLEIFYSVFKYIYDNYNEKLDLKTIAANVGFSTFYVSHMVKETCGLTLQELINYVRVEYAEKFMQEKKLTLTQVSDYAGFSSPAYFNRCFTDWHGITPSQYKKMKRPEIVETHGSLDRNYCISLLKDYVHKPVNPDEFMKNELNEIADSLNKDDLWLLLQLARKLRI